MRGLSLMLLVSIFALTACADATGPTPAAVTTAAPEFALASVSSPVLPGGMTCAQLLTYTLIYTGSTYFRDLWRLYCQAPAPTPPPTTTLPRTPIVTNPPKIPTCSFSLSGCTVTATNK